MTDLISNLAYECRPSMPMLASQIHAKFHAVKILYTKERSVVSSGRYAPLMDGSGASWMNATCTLDLPPTDKMMRWKASSVVDNFSKAQEKAMMQILGLIERNFYQWAGRTINPNGCRFHILGGWWMQQTVIENLAKRRKDVFIDCTYAFERLPQRTPAIFMVPAEGAAK